MVPQSAICKLEPQGSCGVNPVEGRRPVSSCGSQAESTSPFLCLLVLCGPSAIGQCPCSLRRALWFTQSTDLSLISSGSTLTETPRKQLEANTWAPQPNQVDT